ncbi:hypothetical protein L3Q67_32910 [Saccharothrix sp. AJ9571]|nr:hypothetical protein L3Q67_32910 [Saccharothrix sp. AJ9571]
MSVGAGRVSSGWDGPPPCAVQPQFFAAEAVEVGSDFNSVSIAQPADISPGFRTG